MIEEVHHHAAPAHFFEGGEGFGNAKTRKQVPQAKRRLAVNRTS